MSTFKRIVGLLVAVSAMCTGALATAGQAQAAGVSWGELRFMTGNRTVCLDAGAAGTAPVVWGCNGNNYQLWKFTRVSGASWYKTYNVESIQFPGRCLDGWPNNSGPNGMTRLTMYACNGGWKQQQWKASVQTGGGGWLWLQNAYTNQCIDMWGSRTSWGTPIVTYGCRFKVDNQAFRYTAGL
ncbi:RICIN domain-containing protein [Kitasatospora sp. NPDC093806]|uniref:RICIN domain-containing protein n=1 Tax=Kitasatospora sp. NPDC093806 TaxID=3155075 RepID=UPI003444AA10